MDHEPVMASASGKAVKPPHPFAYFLLYLPFGLSIGYIGTLGYLLAKGGVATAPIATLAALFVGVALPLSITSPLVDLTGSYRGWFAVSTLLTGIAIAAFGFVPKDAAHMPLLTSFALLLAVASRLSHQAADGLIAHVCPQEKKGVAGAWTQAANVGGSGIGGGLGIYLADHTPFLWISPLSVGLLCAVCSVAFFTVREPERAHHGAGNGGIGLIWQRIAELFVDLWRLTRSRLGALALFLSLLPIGTGAASNLFSAIGGQWHASGDLIALVTGVGGGMVAIVGSLFGGYLCDIFDRKNVYIVIGLISAALTAVMAVLPKTPMIYAGSVLLYTAISGAVYAAFYAYAQEASGRGTAASKLALMIGISNVPISAMTYVDGLANTRWGTNGMLLIETVLGVIACIVFVAVRLVTRPKAANATA